MFDKPAQIRTDATQLAPMGCGQLLKYPCPVSGKPDAYLAPVVRRRPARPAWTGSPDRKASQIPPVEIPQAIRDRASSNGTSHDPEAGAVLTPPGAGGDIHGGPMGPGPSVPEPPAPV